MNNKSSYFKLYPNYIPIKGKFNCIIADIRNGEYFEIPYLLYEILNINNINSFNLSQLNDYFDNKYTSGIQEYFNLFTQKRIGTYLDSKNKFVNISYKYKSPFKVTNAIIEVDNPKKYCISTLIESLISLGCYEIEIRIINYNTLITILEILNKFSTSRVRSFYLIYQSEYNEGNLNLENEINSNLKINQLKIFNYLSDIKGQKDKIFYIKKPYIEDYGFTSLIINPVYFYESQKFNASLNQKITVDKNGNIKNYISHKKTFGNINNKKINDVLVDDEFTKIWYISNDQIEICKECQYRYFCLNFSEIIEKKGKFFKLNYCNKLYLK